MTSPRLALLTMAASACLALTVPQTLAAQDEAARPRVGVALSGGSAKGFAHIGVLRVLEEAGLRIDVVTGTSMGSVVGALYAIGMPVDSIEALVRSVDWNNVLADGSARARRFLHQRRFDDRAIATLPVQGGSVTLPAGAIVGSNIVRLAEVAMWRAATVRSFDALPRSYAAIATDIVTGEAVRLTRGTLPEAVRASAGIPGAFEPVLLDGQLLVDGGLSRNLPASDAKDLGADFVICSDVSDPLARLDQLGTLFDVLNQVTNLSILQSTEVERSSCDILVRTDVEGLSSLAFDRAAEWIERGTVAARDHRSELEGLAARQGPPPAPTAPFRPLPDTVRVMSIAVEGADRPETEVLVRQELGLGRGSYVSRTALSDRLSNLDATGLFGLVRSRIDAAPGGVALTISVQERRNDRFGVGIRYDDTRLAALLFNLTLHNRIRYGSVTRFDLRVGEETRARVAYLRRQGVTGRFEGGVSLGWSKGELRPSEQAPSDIELTTLSSFLGISGRRTTFVGLEATAERALTDAAALADVVLVSGALVADHESLDRYDFPRRGSDASLKWELGVTDLVAGGNFSVFVAGARSYVPLLPRLTLDLGMFLGHGRGRDLPLHRTFFVGGVHPSTVFPDSKPTFHGLAEQELNGRHAQIARAGLRLQAREGAFVRVGLDAGGVADRWRLPIAERIYGWGLTLGLTSVIGPVLLEWGKASNGSGVRLSLGVGRRF